MESFLLLFGGALHPLWDGIRSRLLGTGVRLREHYHHTATYRLQTRPSRSTYNLHQMDRMIAFGTRMKAIREDRGYSQELLADLAHLHRTYIGGVERGERNVSLVNIWRIADALEVPPSSLFADTRDAASPGGLPAAKRGARRGR